jgi:hypothetical protein
MEPQKEGQDGFRLMPSTIERAAEHLGRATAALDKVNGSAKAVTQLLALLGWAPPPGVNDIGLAQLDVSIVAARIDDLTELRSQEGASDADLAIAVAAVVGAVADTIDDIEQMVASFQASPDYLSATDIRDQFFDRVADLLLIHAIGSVVPAAIPVGALLGVFEFTHLPADPSIFQVEHVRQVVRWDRLSTLFTNPTDLLRDVYGWGTANFRGNALVGNIGRVMEFISADTRLRALPRPAEEQLAGRPVPEAEIDPAAQLFVSLDKGLGFGAFDAGLTLYALRPTTPGGTDGGIGVSPYVFGTTETSFQLSDNLSLVLSGSAALQGGIALLLRAGQDPEFLTGLLDTVDTGTPGAPAAAFTMALRSAAADGGRQTLFSAPNVVIDAAAVTAGIGITAGPDLNPSFLFKVEDGRIHVAPDDADGFLASILPADGITTTVDLEASWSHRDGLQIKGGTGLSTVLDLHQQAGPLRLDSLGLALKAGPDGLTGNVGVSGAASIGPVSASVAGLGAAVALKFARGNLGPVDLGARFLPPNGIGLSVEAKGVLTGGGFLFRDDSQHLYAGAMQLSLHEQITLKAFGLIATRMPDGRRGYSLIVFITAEDFRPIPLGLGFMLLGIGGMIGVNRTFDQDVLRQGLKNGTLATLLFPRDPVGNAPALIRSLASAFPARRGSYLLGLVAKISWFNPTLVLMDLALILEFGSRERLLALGRISARLPSADNDLVRLNMEAMGVIDFDAGTAAIDAVLMDSRLAHKFPITGSAALRAGFGAGPSFVLSVGGFNPRFAPPAGVPALERVAIALSSGNNPRLLCEAYFAITSNTVQFGARAALYASAAGFSVEGDVGFDVLVQIAPLHFIADFHARLQLKRGSHNLFMVSLAGALEGPRPLRVSGKATFEILWWDFSVHFDTTLVHGEPPPLPPAVNVLAQLTQALASPSSWSTQRSATHTHGVALRSLPPASATAPIVLDPLGQLLVTQQAVPLNTARDIDTFGGAPVAGARRFALTAALNGTPLLSASVQAPFAPAQFFVMSDDEKLAAPSSEAMDAGCVFGDAHTVFDPAQVIPAPLEYQTISITLQGSSSSPSSGFSSAHAVSAVAPAPYTMSPAQLQTFTRSGAAARAPVRRVGRARFRNDAVEGAASFNPKRWTIMPNGDGPAATVDPGVHTWSEYQAALKALNRGGARWQIVPTHEIDV